MVRGIITDDTMADKYVYKALFSYVPNGTDGDDILLDKDDILVVTLPLPEGITIDDDLLNPKTWLYGKNTNKNTEGFFPGNFTELVQHDQPVAANIPPPIPEKPTTKQQPPQTGDDSGYEGTPKSKNTSFV